MINSSFIYYQGGNNRQQTVAYGSMFFLPAYFHLIGDKLKEKYIPPVPSLPTSPQKREWGGGVYLDAEISNFFISNCKKTAKVQ